MISKNKYFRQMSSGIGEEVHMITYSFLCQLCRIKGKGTLELLELSELFILTDYLDYG